MRGPRLLAAAALAATSLVLSPLPASAAVTSEFDGDHLLVQGDDEDDSITIACTDGRVKVNGVDPDTGAADCSDVAFIHVRAGAGNDLVTLPVRAYSGVDHMRAEGGPGDDVLSGSGVFDELFGGSGVDELTGGPGGDWLSPGADGGSVDGQQGVDNLFAAGAGSWTITNQSVTLSTAVPLIIPMDSIEVAWIRAGSGNDSLDATAFQGRSRLNGRSGDDELIAGDGNDRLFGAEGDDHLLAGGGNDWLRGGRGNDVLRGHDGADQMSGSNGEDDCRGGAGEDRITQCE